MNATANRVTAATLGGALTVLLFWSINLSTGITPPTDVTIAMTTVMQFVTSVGWSRFGGFSGGDLDG